MTIQDRLADVLHQLFGIPRDAVEPDVTLADELQLDSLSIVELQLALEDAFAVNLDDHGATDVTTVGDLVGVLRAAVGSQEEAS